MADQEQMSVEEFQRLGYLLEVNRRFLHPLGLALEIGIDMQTNEVALVGIWDNRADPEGITYDELDAEDMAKRDYIRDEWHKREPARVALMGSMIQPFWDGS